jgi:hypothetical protein
MRKPPDTEAPSSPLAQTLARLRFADPYLAVHLGDPGAIGGASLASILEGDSPLLDTHLAAMAAHYQTDEREVLARFYLSGFTFHLAHFAVGAFVREQRVPILAPASLGLTCNGIGFPIALALSQDQFFCLPRDGAVDYLAAMPVGDEDALRTQLRDQLVAACEPLIAALRQRARLGERALWIAAAETCAAALIDALPPGTSTAAAVEAVQALVGDAASPLRAHPEIIAPPNREGVINRLGILGSDCCCMYRLPDQPYCATCPHLPRAERIAALQTWLAAQTG